MTNKAIWGVKPALVSPVLKNPVAVKAPVRAPLKAAPKEARLAAVAVSAAIRCEYCISAQVHLAKKEGATDDEIKAAVQIAAEIQRFSVLLYGNEFGLDNLERIIGKQ